MANDHLYAALKLGLGLKYVRYKQRLDQRRIPLTPTRCQHHKWRYTKRPIERKPRINCGSKAWRIWPQILERFGQNPINRISRSPPGVSQC